MQNKNIKDSKVLMEKLLEEGQEENSNKEGE